MAKDITPTTPAKLASLNVPEVGDPGDPTQIEAGWQGILNALEYLQADHDNHLSSSGGSWASTGQMTVLGNSIPSGNATLQLGDGDNVRALYITANYAGGGAYIYSNSSDVTNPALEVEGVAASSATQPEGGIVVTGRGNDSGNGGKGVVVTGGASTAADNAGGLGIEVVGGADTATGGNGGTGGDFTGGAGATDANGYGGDGLRSQGGDAGIGGIGVYARGGVSSEGNTTGYGVYGRGADATATNADGAAAFYAYPGSRNGSGTPAAAYVASNSVGSPLLSAEYDNYPTGYPLRNRGIYFNYGLHQAIQFSGGSTDIGSVGPFAKVVGYTNGTGDAIIVASQSHGIESCSVSSSILDVNFDGTIPYSYTALAKYISPALVGGGTEEIGFLQMLHWKETSAGGSASISFRCITSSDTAYTLHDHRVGFQILFFANP